MKGSRHARSVLELGPELPLRMLKRWQRKFWLFFGGGDGGFAVSHFKKWIKPINTLIISKVRFLSINITLHSFDKTKLHVTMDTAVAR